MDNEKGKKAVNEVEFFEPFKKSLLTLKCVTLMEKAQKTVADMDKLDGGINIVRLSEWLRTIMTALLGGINEENFNLIAESYVMLAQLEKQARELEKGSFKMKDPKYEKYYLNRRDLEVIMGAIEKERPRNFRELWEIVDKNKSSSSEGKLQ